MKKIALFITACFALTCLVAKDGEKKAKKNAKKERETIEVCFVLDTTGSMGGLIEGAKQKIWSIASKIAPDSLRRCVVSAKCSSSSTVQPVATAGIERGRSVRWLTQRARRLQQPRQPDHLFGGGGRSRGVG